jgi:outer membrane protein
MKTTLRLTTLVAAAAVFCCGATAAQAQQLKVGVVDMNKVFSGYYKTKDAENKINDAREVAKKELDDRMESHKQLLDEINQLNKDIDNAALSASAKADRQKKREEKIQQVRSLEQEITDFKQSREKQLQEQAVRMRNQIVEEIMTIINAKVKSDNYDLVFDKSGQSLNGVQIVLHSNDKMEFSDDVITALNKNRPSSVAPAASAAPAASPKR